MSKLGIDYDSFIIDLVTYPLHIVNNAFGKIITINIKTFDLDQYFTFFVR